MTNKNTRKSETTHEQVQYDMSFGEVIGSLFLLTLIACVIGGPIYVYQKSQTAKDVVHIPINILQEVVK